MAVVAQASPIVSAGGAETELKWTITTDLKEFRSKPPRRGRVRVLDQSALLQERQNRREAFLAAQIEGQKIYNK